MERLNLIIFDYDNEYVEALSNLFNKRYYKYFRITGINDYKQLEDIISAAKKVDILLVNEGLSNRVSSLKFIKNIIYLCENKTNQDVDEGKVYKYQSCSSIYNSIKRIYKSINKNVDFEEDDDESYLITVSSPIGGVGKTSIAMGIVNKMVSNGKKVLYINLEEINAMSIFFDIKKNYKNISDLFYNVNENQENVKSIINSIVNKSENGIWYINPPNSTLDLAELTSNNFIKSINCLKMLTDFDYIIADLGSAFNTIYSSLLQIADKNLLIIQQSNVGIEKISSLLNQIERTDNINLIVNKYIKEKKIQLTDEIAKIKDNIFHYIELDDVMDNNDLSLDVISGKSKFSFSMEQLALKLSREENILHG